ncbi:MAG TPA: hypothetical protein VMA09_23335 [Candidatus Binataceae bacterium]|nr:hypothetical protein [Candidatus Binataceae bacterium]
MFDVGDKVRIIAGSFCGFNGRVEEVRAPDQRARVAISIYGRDEMIELDFSQLEPINIH